MSRWTQAGARLGRSPLAALGAIVLVLGLLWGRTPLAPLGVFDQGFYVGIADDLLNTGRFTDGVLWGTPGPDGTRPPGMRFAPLYPTLLAGAALLDAPFRAAMDCAAGSRFAAACPTTAAVARGAQFALLAGVYLLLWWLARRVTGRARAGWVALGLGLLAAPPLAASAHYLMTEIVTLMLTTGATAAAVAAWGSPRPRRWVALAGLLLGLTALTRPAFLYLFLALALGWAGLAVRRRGAAVLLGLFALGFVVPTAPWIARNAVVMGRPALTFGYDSHTLVQRISFDAMTGREYALSYLCWLPDGSGLGKLLVGPRACDRFAWDERPDTFYAIGTGPLMAQTVQAAGGWEHHLGYLLTHFILRAPLWHAAVTVPFALRGALIDHYWGLVLGLLCLGLTGRAVRRRDAVFLTLAGPGWFMLAFHAAVAVNQPRYNLMLMIPYAVGGALVVERWIARRAGGLPRPG